MKYLIILQGGFIVLKIIDKILFKFYSVFTYEATFNWFVIVVIGFMGSCRSYGRFQFYPMALFRPRTL